MLIKTNLLMAMLFLTSCSSYQQFRYYIEDYEIPSSVFQANLTQTWQAVVQVMKQFDLEEQNQEAGVIKTRWIDNTKELNFADSFGTNDAVRAAKFKLVLNIGRGFRGKKEVSRVTVYRRQLVEQDFLQGWKEIPSDNIQEKVVLYRIERLIKIDNQLKKIEQAQAQSDAS